MTSNGSGESRVKKQLIVPSTMWPSTHIFDFKDVLLLGTGFILITVFSNRFTRFICERIIEFDCPSSWPLSQFEYRMPDLQRACIAVVALILFYTASYSLARVQYALPSVILAGSVLLLTTNLIQGWEAGFVTPIAGGGENGIQYYHDAVKVKDVYQFVNQFEWIQPNLLTHSRTHPPGTVLIIYLLHKVFRPSFISIIIAVTSILLSGLFMHGILSNEFKNRTIPGFMVFLFVLIPSTQIYYAASLDALIAGLLLGALYFFLQSKLVTSTLGSILCLFLASLLSFGFVFFLPVMLGVEFMRKRSVSRSALVLLGLGIAYIILDRALGFNYIDSFMTASGLENPHGFRLISEPASYIFTRLEGIFEIVLFFGPFLAILMVRGLRLYKGAGLALSKITRLAMMTLLAMFITGAFRTGETARVCLFIYPYLMFPIATYLENAQITLTDKNLLLFLTFIQTVLMQTFGFYFW